MTEKSKGKEVFTSVQPYRREGIWSMFASFRHRDFRLLWIGLLFGVTGWWMQVVAMGWLVLQLTDSPFWLGLANAAASFPMLIFSLFGGAVADRVDRRKLLMLTRVILSAMIFLLAALVLSNVIEVWHVMVISVISGIVFAFDIPARQAMIPSLVEPGDLMNAISLGSAVINVAAIVGPAIAGFLVAFFGVGGVFVLVGIGYLGLVVMLIPMRIPPVEAVAGISVWQNITDGLVYLRDTGSLALLILMTVFVNVIGMPYQTLMPVFARDVLEVGSSGMGIMMSAAGVGALVSSLALASLGNFKSKGTLLLGTAFLFGVSLAGFSQAGYFPLALFFLAIVGAGATAYNTLTATLVQGGTPAELQGRVMSTFILVWGLVPVGSIAAGASASAFGAPITMTAAGVLVAVFAVFLVFAKPVILKL